MIIFDDIDVIGDKKVKDKVYGILNQILEISRHYKHWCICTNHLATNKEYTKRILNEAHWVVFFPMSISRQLRYLLTEYLGMDKKLIYKLKKLKSRHITFYKNYPNFILSQRNIFLINNEDD